ALRTFEKNLLPTLQSAVEIQYGVRNERPQFFSRGQVTFVDLPIMDRLCTERFQNAVVFADLGLQFFREQNRLHQIRDAQSGAGGLVAISGPDAPFGGADFDVPFAELALLVERAMIRQNQVGTVADKQISFADLNPGLAQGIYFENESNWIHH